MSDALAARIQALEKEIASPNPDARSAVRELLVDDGGRYLVMERLPRLGSSAAGAIRELLAEPTTDDEVRAMAALVGLEVGERVGIDVLEAEVARAGALGPLSAARLAAHEESVAASAILQGLRTLDTSDADPVVAYLDALRKTGASLPADVRDRLASSPAWQVTSAVADWFPDP